MKKTETRRSAQMDPASIITPVVKPSRFARALVPMEPSMIRTHKGGVVHHFRLDYRALERNKYAPWGRGHASGMQ